jgi:hypothetical protein
MTSQSDITHLSAAQPDTAPVAMQRGGHDDRTLLARLRVERSWLVRDRDKAGLAPEHPPVLTDTALLLLRLVVGITLVVHGSQKLGDLSETARFSPRSTSPRRTS